jgi:hypothetical protein
VGSPAIIVGGVAVLIYSKIMAAGNGFITYTSLGIGPCISLCINLTGYINLYRGVTGYINLLP